MKDKWNINERSTKGIDDIVPGLTQTVPGLTRNATEILMKDQLPVNV